MSKWYNNEIKIINLCAQNSVNSATATVPRRPSGQLGQPGLFHNKASLPNECSLSLLSPKGREADAVAPSDLWPVPRPPSLDLSIGFLEILRPCRCNMATTAVVWTCHICTWRCGCALRGGGGLIVARDASSRMNMNQHDLVVPMRWLASYNVHRWIECKPMSTHEPRMHCCGNGGRLNHGLRGACAVCADTMLDDIHTWWPRRTDVCGWHDKRLEFLAACRNASIGGLQPRPHLITSKVIVA